MNSSRLSQVFSTMGLAFGLTTMMVSAQAETYPQRPIRIVVASTAGSAPDALARILGIELTAALKQPVIIDNKPGAGGVIGIDSVAKSLPDGYTLGIGHDGTMAINTVLYQNLPYNPVTDFTAIAPLALNEFVLIANSATGVKTFPDFIAFVKKHNGTANYASAGNGTPNHVFMEQLLQEIGATMVHIPYKGGAAAVGDVASGQVQFMLAGLAPALPQIKAKRVDALAVVQDNRASSLPDVPTVGETIPNFALKTWFGLFAPANTKPEVVSLLNLEVQKILARPEVRQKLSQQGMQVESGSPTALAELVRSDVKRYKVLATKIKLQAN